MSKGGANLPLARVRTIMKSSPEVENVNQESLFLVTRATVSYKKKRFWYSWKARSDKSICDYFQEFFIMYLSKLGQRNGDDHNSVTYSDLAGKMVCVIQSWSAAVDQYFPWKRILKSCIRESPAMIAQYGMKKRFYSHTYMKIFRETNLLHDLKEFLSIALH